MRSEEKTLLVFILDRSGSMAGKERDVIGGFNSLIEKERNRSGKCYIKTVLFDNRINTIYDCEDIRRVRPMTEKEYYVGGSTSLLDAVGKTINELKPSIVNYDKILVVIMTDGYENSSVEYNYKQVKNLINDTKRCGVEYLFLGADIDACKSADEIGISRDRSVSYVGDKKGTEISYSTLAKTIATFREGEGIRDDWSKDIDEDFTCREG